MKKSDLHSSEPFISVAPGRLCLFGEHQDYLHLPVIALALPLFCRIEAKPAKDSRVLSLSFRGIVKCIDLDNLPQQIQKSGERDFMLSAVQEVLADGWILPCGADCVSSSTIPLQAGCSSSSAFCVAWIQVLAALAGKSLTPIQVAQLAHRAEVAHFGAPGGTMDHMTSAIGGLLRIGPGMWDYKSLEARPADEVWVLAYSGEPKDTLKHLSRCKEARLALLKKLGGNWDNKDAGKLSEDELVLLWATRTNRDTERKAAAEWTTASGHVLGSYMNQHFASLRDGLLLSTAKLDAMGNASLEAGAWGFKLVGSGGGGCGVAWCSSDRAELVEKCMKDSGATATWVITGGNSGASISRSDS